MILSDLPDDIIGYINECVTDIKIKELIMKYDNLLHTHIIYNLKFYTIIEIYICNEYIDIKNLDLPEDFNEFKSISIIDIDFIKQNTKEETILELYGYICDIRKLKKIQEYNYDKYKVRLYEILYNVFERKILYIFFDFLKKFRNQLHDYLDIQENMIYQERLNDIALYFRKHYLCRDENYKNNFSEYLRNYLCNI